MNKRCYPGCANRFSNHLENRNFFYTCDLNPYHFLSFDQILAVKHTVDTEYSVTKLPPGADEDEVEMGLARVNPRDYIGRHYLNTFDLLIISMGIELKRIVGKEVYLLTNDRRLALISGKNLLYFPGPCSGTVSPSPNWKA